MALLRIDATPEALRLEGEIDLAVADQFTEALQASIASGTTSVDLSGVTFIDSMGLCILLMAGRRLEGLGPLVLLRPSKAVRRLLDTRMAGGHHALAVRDDIATVAPAFEESLPWTVAVGAAARRAIRARLGDRLTEDQLADAQLIATELATNAFSHAPPVVDEHVILLIDVTDQAVRIAVIDGGAGFVPDWEDEPDRSPSGLRVVDKIATAWGISDDGVNAVWAEVARV